MTIEKEGDKVIIKLDFWQSKNNPYDVAEEKEQTHNLIGVIAGDDLTISKLNDLSYKDAQQEGAPLICYQGNEENFVKLCQKLGLQIIKHEICAECHKPIYGISTISEKGFVCFECQLKDENN